jgi:3-deoxy-D-manno-octulosonic-acid transferase
LLLVNARLSERSARRYAAFPGLVKQALAGLGAIAAQGRDDAARLEELGASGVVVTGNMKFDITPPERQLELGRAMRAGYGDRQVLLAASTREGEEELILDALRSKPIPGLLLVIVPRHPQRFDAVATLTAGRGFALQRRSANEPLRPETSVLIGDTMGEMFAYFAACDVAFIGGSLLDYGSQNLIEACAVGTPLLVGPSTHNFSEVAREALACGAACQVQDAESLIATARKLLGDAGKRLAMGSSGREFAARHRGASERTLSVLARFLAP